MAENISNSGNAQAVFQLSVKSDKSQEEITLSKAALHQQTVYTEILENPATSSSQLVTQDSVFVNQILQPLMGSGNPDVRIRLGLGIPGQYVWTPWENHTVTTFSVIPHSIGDQDGFLVKLETADILAKISRITKVASRRGKLSEIVQQIADENDIKNVVIEPTTETVSLIQSYEDDASFIARRLAPRAVNKQGCGNYRFFARDNVLHFHTAAYQANVRQIDYFNRSSGINLVQTDRTQERLLYGAAKVKAIVFDPVTGETKTIESREESTLKFGNSPPNLDIQNAELTVPIHVSDNLESDIAGRVQSMFEYQRSQVYELLLTTTKTPQLRIGDIIGLNLSPTPSKKSPWSGYYTVVSCKHMITQGNLNSSFVLQRGEQNSINQSAPSAVQRQINPSVVDASSKTRGPETLRLRTVLSPT